MHRLKQFFSPLKGNLLVLVISHLVLTFTTQIVQPYESLYILALGGTGLTFSLISVIQVLIIIATSAPGGYIADKWGRKKIVGVVTSLTSFSYLFYVFARDWTWIVVGASLSYLIYLYTPALFAIRADSVKPEERGRGFVLLNVLPEIPALISPALGGILVADKTSMFGISTEGVKIGFFLLFLGMLSAGLIRLRFLKETLPRQITGTEAEKSGDILTMFRETYKTVIRSDAAIRKIVILNGFFLFCFHFETLFRGVYAIKVRGLSAEEWGLIVSVSQIFSIMIILIIGDLIDRYGRKKIFVPAILVLLLANVIFIFSGSFLSFLIAMILTASSVKARLMSFQVLIADAIPRESRGRLLSAIGLLGSLGTNTSMAISGVLFDFSPVLPFYAASVMYSAATLTAIAFLKEAEIRQE